MLYLWNKRKRLHKEIVKLHRIVLAAVSLFWNTMQYRRREVTGNLVLTTPENTITYHNALYLSPPKIQFFLGVKMAPRESENNAYAKCMHTSTKPTIPHIVLFHDVWFAYLGKCPSPKTSRLCHMGLKNLCSNDTECNYIDGGVCCFDGCRRRCATSESFPDRLESKISYRFYFVVVIIDMIILQQSWLMPFRWYSTLLNSRLPCGR